MIELPNRRQKRFNQLIISTADTTANRRHRCRHSSSCQLQKDLVTNAREWENAMTVQNILQLSFCNPFSRNLIQ